MKIQIVELPKTPLVVHKVGKYDVSVAPTLSYIVEDEFLRKSYTVILSPSFQAGKQQFHPLGYTHPRADHIFIPTLHWHHGGFGNIKISKWVISIMRSSY